MNIHIKWSDDKKAIQLPILPPSFMVEDSINNTTVTIHNLGDINLKGKRGLWGLSFSAFFPGQKYDFAKTEYHDPYEYYIKKLKNLFENNTTIHVIITETDINGYFTIEAFEYGHEEKGNDVSYSLELREYREPSASGRVNKGASNKSHTWKKGDTWQKVTKKALGSSDKWKAVRKNNKSVRNKALKKHPKKKEKDALVGYKVVVKA